MGLAPTCLSFASTYCRIFDGLACAIRGSARHVERGNLAGKNIRIGETRQAAGDGGAN
jgi:hypothetical protein